MKKSTRAKLVIPGSMPNDPWSPRGRQDLRATHATHQEPNIRKRIDDINANAKDIIREYALRQEDTKTMIVKIKAAWVRFVAWLRRTINIVKGD